MEEVKHFLFFERQRRSSAIPICGPHQHSKFEISVNECARIRLIELRRDGMQMAMVCGGVESQN